MATFAIKTVISAVDNITGTLAGVNKGIKNTFKPIRDLYNSTQKLQKELGFPKVGRAMRGVNKAFGSVAGEVKALGKDLAIVTGAATAAISALAWRTSSVGDAAAKTAQKVGVSTQAWTELAHAGSMSGVAASTLQGGLTRLNKNISEAARGGKNASAMFGYLGINIYDAEGKLKTADVVMGEAADRLNQIDDAAHRSALAAEIFGRSAGPEMIPLLNEGKAGIDALRQEAVDLGITFNDVEGKQSEAFSDSMERLTAALDGVIFTIGKQLLPPLTEWAGKLKDLIVANRELIGQKVGEWIQRIQDYLPTLEEKIKAVWEGVTNFAAKIDSLVQSLGGWEAVLPYIVAGIAAIQLAPLAAAVVSLTTAVAGLGVALLTTPIGWIALGIAGLVAGFIYLWNNFEGFRNFWISTWDAIVGYFSGIVERIRSAFDQGIVQGILAILNEFNPLTHIVRAMTAIVEYVAGLDLGFGTILDAALGVFIKFNPLFWIYSAMDAVLEYLTGFSLADAGMKIITSLLDGLIAAWDGVVGWFGKIGESISDLIPESLVDVLKTAQSIGGGVVGAVSNVTGGAIDAAGSVLGAIGDWWGGENPDTAAGVSSPGEAPIVPAVGIPASPGQAQGGYVLVEFKNLPPGAEVSPQGPIQVKTSYDPFYLGRRTVGVGGFE